MRTTSINQHNHPRSGTGTMRDIDKSREQLINELVKMRQRLAKLEMADTERKRTEHELTERVKELKCLYGVAEVAERPDITLDELYQEVVNLLPSSWQYPEITGARIIIDNKKFKTKNCRDTEWKQSSDVKVHGAKAGKVEVSYLEERPEIDEGPFLKEERRLIDAVAERLGRITERMQMEQRVEHLNLVLRAIRNVNQLIAKEKNRDRLLKGACDNLVESCGYYDAWVAILDESGSLVTTAEAGLGREFSLMVERLKRGEFTNCARRALRQSGIVLIENPPSTCGDCPLVENYQGRGAMAVRLEHSGKVYGILSVSIPADFTADKEEQALFKEVASDIAFALHNIDLEEEHKQMEETLSDEATRRRILIEQSRDGIVVLDQNGKVYESNQRFAEMLGYSPEEVLQLHVWDWEFQFTREQVVDMIRNVDETGDHFETQHRRKDGTIYDVEISTNGAVFAGQKLIFCVCRDITERREAEEALMESEEKYRTFIESSHEVVFSKDRDGCYHTLNLKAVIGLGGTCIEDVEGKNDYDLLPKEQADALRKIDKQIMKSGKPVEVEEVARDAKGENRIYLSYKWPTYDDKGRIAGISCFATDITERRRAEEELRESEERYRALMSLGDRVGEAVIMLQDNEQGDAIHTFVSDQWPRITGYSREELLGMSFFDLVHPEDRQASLKRHKRKMSGESIPGLFEMPIIRKDGAEVPIELTSAYTTYRGEHTNVAFVRDITERKQAEEETRNLAKFPSENPNPVMRIAQNGTILYANKASLPLLGVWGCRVGQLLPDYLLQPVLGVLDSGLHKYIEVECGEQIFSFMFAHVVEADYINLYGRDITERKQAEVEKRELEQKAQLASRLASVGEMAAGVAHEINNPLTGVIGFAQLLMRKNIPDDIKESVKVINDGAQRVADIINRLLIFARQRKPERGYVDINEIIETTLSLRAYEMETANIKVTTRLAPDLPRTMADSGQLQQLFLNIIINAETEMKLAHGRGSLLIKTETIGSSISISFKDDGPGIAKKNLGRIFDPFFTTREVGSGTGLGLSLCHGIVAEHNGYIYARSRLGSGATFVVELPIVIEDKQLELPEPTADEAERVAGAKILVVDDEPAVLKLLEQVLTDAGHEVVTTDHADDALNKIKRGQYNLILLDIKLPGMSGIELYKRIQKVSGSLASRVIFITGDIMGADTRDFFSQTKAHYITKPLDIEQLKREIDSQLYQGA